MGPSSYARNGDYMPPQTTINVLGASMGPRSYARNGSRRTWLRLPAGPLQWGRAVARGTGQTSLRRERHQHSFNGATQLRAERA